MDTKILRIQSLLSGLEDPFENFPLQSVIRRLTDLVDESEARISERGGWWGVSPRYRSVDDEHDIDVVQLFLGSVFVLGQANIARAVSITKRVYELAPTQGHSSVPTNKSIMETKAPIHRPTGVSKIVIIHEIANYFKHSVEWPEMWNETEAKNRQLPTIVLMRRLGFTPRDEENLYIGLNELGGNVNRMTVVSETIQMWREAVAQHIRSRVQLK